MLKYLLAAVALITASPAAAKEHVVIGADPTPHYQVYEGDTLVLRKPMGRELKADGSRDRTFSVWIDRVNGRGFATDGATKLTAVGYDATKGYIYAPLDAVAEPVTAPAPTGPVWGINLSGCSFTADGALCPTVADLNTYLDKGFTMVRLSFKGTQMATPAIRAKVVALTKAATDRGAYVILDRHDYSWPSVDSQVNYWVDLMGSFPASDLIIIDPMNEPKGFNDTVVTNDWDQWARDINPIIAGLRSAGVNNTIAAEYPSYSATFRADKNEAATKASESALTALDRAGGLRDPLNKTLINGHRYLDSDSSGTHVECASSNPGIDSFAAVLRKRGLKGIVTELAFGRHDGIPASCVAPGDLAIQQFRDNTDVLVGVTWWGGGRAWGESYLFKVEPLKGTFATAPNSPYLDKLLGK